LLRSTKYICVLKSFIARDGMCTWSYRADANRVDVLAGALETMPCRQVRRV